MCLVKPPALWGIGRPGFLSSALRLLHRVNAGPRCVLTCWRGTSRCGRINAMRHVPVKASEDRARQSRPGSSPTSHRPAPCADVWLWFPKAKPCITNANVHRRTAHSSVVVLFFSRGTRRTIKRPTRHRTHQITDLEQTSQTGENARRDRVLAYHSLALSLNFTQLPVPYSPVHPWPRSSVKSQ